MTRFFSLSVERKSNQEETKKNWTKSSWISISLFLMCHSPCCSTVLFPVYICPSCTCPKRVSKHIFQTEDIIYSLSFSYLSRALSAPTFHFAFTPRLIDIKENSFLLPYSVNSQTCQSEIAFTWKGARQQENDEHPNFHSEPHSQTFRSAFPISEKKFNFHWLFSSPNFPQAFLRLRVKLGWYWHRRKWLLWGSNRPLLWTSDGWSTGWSNFLRTIIISTSGSGCHGINAPSTSPTECWS